MANQIAGMDVKDVAAGMILTLITLYVIANMTSQSTCNNFGLTYQGSA